MDPLRRRIVQALSLASLSAMTIGSSALASPWSDRRKNMRDRMRGNSRSPMRGRGRGGNRPMPAATPTNTNLTLSPKQLKIPQQDTGQLIDGKRVFNLNLQKGKTEFFDGVLTNTIGINSDYLGSTLRASRGDQVQFNITNKLGEVSTVHWHGMHIPPTVDGGPHQNIKAGATWQPEFEINQEAATLFYHSHTMDKTGEQVYRGYAGMFIIDDEISSRLDLPSDYGVDDIPLIIQDRKFKEDGSFQYVSSMRDRMMGMKGDTILVNGTTNPYVNVERRLIRFRILNASNARFYNLGFDDNRNFYQIASDGGFLNKPVRLNRLRLSPGERAEILVAFQNGNECKLQNYPDQSAGMGRRGASRRRMFGGGRSAMQDTDVMDILNMKPVAATIASHPLPSLLNNIPQFNEADVQKTRRFFMSMSRGRFAINGKTMDMKRIDEVVKLGSTEIWEIRNPMMMAHNFHVHDVQFQILSRNGRRPAQNEQGWKDTVILNPRETVKIVMNFADYADDTVPYMYHCHILEHEDQGMMGQFLVVNS